MVVSAPERLALAREVAARLATGPGVTSAFVAGSLAVGLGNHTSDVDVHLAGPSLEPGREQVFAGPVRVDVHRIPTAALAETVRRVVAATLRSDDGADVVADRDVTTAVRLHGGEIVVDGGAAGLRRTLREHDLTLRRLVITRWLNLAHYGQEDLAGLIDEPRDADSATMVARLLLRTAGKALAAACGDLFPGEKWVWRQLDRSAPAGFPHDRFRRLLRADPLADGPPADTPLTDDPLADGPLADDPLADDPLADDPLADTPDAVRLADLRRFAQTCLAATAALGWHGVAMARWPRWLAGDGPLRRAAELSVRAYADGVVLTRPDSRRVRLSHAAALVWALCDGVDAATLRRDVAGLGAAHAPAGELTPARVTELVDRLLAAGLVTGGPA
ncbi:hypothetical protein [Micromonospora okii]|uniref:hypothetical protein n=1 Tax=Micromonospora okii TaxID=1182970 RepID=UPI001E3102EA|nr:hypothetical protein [Micromonospora okii]